MSIDELRKHMIQVRENPYIPTFDSERGYTERQCVVVWKMTRQKILSSVDDLLMFGTSPDVCFQLLAPWVHL